MPVIEAGTTAARIIDALSASSYKLMGLSRFVTFKEPPTSCRSVVCGVHLQHVETLPFPVPYSTQ